VVCKRFRGSLRRECLGYILILSERNLQMGLASSACGLLAMTRQGVIPL
jgi:hypothetical protein